MNEIFKSPYDKYLAKSEGIALIRVAAELHEPDVTFFKLIRPSQGYPGTLAPIIGILWRKLYIECNERGITDYSRKEDFESFCLTSKLISASEWAEFCDYRRRSRGGLPNGTPSGAVPQSNPSNDGVGSPSTRNDGTANATVVSNIQSRGGKGRGTRGQDKKGKDSTESHD